MKKFVVSFCLVALGLGAGLTMPRILAQTDATTSVQKWEQLCEEEKGRGTRLNDRLKARGANGFELVGAVPVGSNYSFVCYRRPLE